MVVQDSSLKKNLEPARKSLLSAPLYKWACSERCQVQSLDFLKSHGIEKVDLEVKCMGCRKKFKMGLKWEAEFNKVLILLSTNQYEVPVSYLSDKTKRCPDCQLNTIMEPVHAQKKKHTNWLGLLLGHEMKTLNFDHLVYFCRQRELKWDVNDTKARLIYLCIQDLVHQLQENRRLKVNLNFSWNWKLRNSFPGDDYWTLEDSSEINNLLDKPKLGQLLRYSTFTKVYYVINTQTENMPSIIDVIWLEPNCIP
ncbi:hypothetical protein ACET3Z_011183 [Daucus carota]